LPQLLRDRHRLGGAGDGTLKYYDYDLYALAPISTETITFTEYHSARLTPASLPHQKAEMIVWTFGGSTMQNLETTDDLSIANTIAKVFISHGIKARVENFGVGAFQSTLELVKFSNLLARVLPAERPKVAIFYDGFNDPYHAYTAGAGVMQHDLSRKLAALVEGRSGKLAIYSASTWVSRYSHFWQTYMHNRIQVALFLRDPPPRRDDDLERSIAIYVNNIRMEDAICNVYSVRCFFVLQPLVVTKEPLGAKERDLLADLAVVAFIRGFYKKAQDELCNKSNFIDASHVLNGRKSDDFFDLGHTGPLTSPVIGAAVADVILERLKAADTDSAINCSR
jgi:hypothetical protein